MGLRRGDAGGEAVMEWAGNSGSRVKSPLLIRAYTIHRTCHLYLHSAVHLAHACCVFKIEA